MTRIRYQHHFGWIVETDPTTNTALVLWDANPNYHTYTLEWLETHTHAV